MRSDFHPAHLAQGLEVAGACALSVLTDEKFFGGSLDILKQVRAVSSLPILRKDFMVDPYQMAEARWAGADAVLLIAGILTFEELTELSRSAAEWKLEVLFEVHSEEDIKKIESLRPHLIGINNRDLKTFKVDLETTSRLLKQLPRSAVTISESGLKTHEDLMYLKSLGIHAFLIGETLMKTKDPGRSLTELIHQSHGAR